MRYALTERVLFHHAKCVASAMLARAARLVGLTEDDRLLHLGDEAFLDHLESLAKGNLGANRLLEALRSEEVKQQFPGVWSRVETIEQQYLGLFASGPASKNGLGGERPFAILH